ncbi:hypothetical protein SB6414_04952 [Klebsiella pasteurii]|nr:hypothetical protein SB6414_04952 [Klebsiella pasteurii]
MIRISSDKYNAVYAIFAGEIYRLGRKGIIQDVRAWLLAESVLPNS